MAEIKDFSKVRKTLQFRVDSDVFQAVSAIPAEVMIQFTEALTSADPSKMSPKEQVGVLRGVLELVLEAESLVKFKERMADVGNPIEIDQINDIVVWLFEEYGMRPTVESVSSVSGGSPPAPGTGSTAATPDRALTSGPSLSTSS
jgi:hypothetical protein